MKNFLRILFLIVILFLGIITIIRPAKTETNILRAVFSKNQNSDLIVTLSNKYSSKINIIIECNEAGDCETTNEKIFENIDKNIFKSESADIKPILDGYKKYSRNLLSDNSRKLLLNKDYETIKQQSFERLLNPLGVSLLPIEEDPFLLFTDYLMSLADGQNYQTSGLLNHDNKLYKIIPLTVNQDLALSPTVINTKIKTLINLQKTLTSANVKIYLTGAPIHSYYASSKSIIEINLICILSTLFIIGLCYFYFRNLKLLIPAMTSLALGIFTGYTVVSQVFGSIHVLTFVFSTTLIGICIDYSLHFFVEKNLSKIFKSLTVSLLTTVSAFFILLFSGLEMLKQISLYTITGLVTVYLFVVLFYPAICKNLFNDYEKHLCVNIPNKFKPLIITLIILIIAGGFYKIKFNDDIKNMYIPSKQLLQAENLFKEITDSNYKTSFLVVEGKNTEEILQKEEKLAENLNNYQSLSKFIPSHKRQKENETLINDLYKTSLKDYAEFLTPAQVTNLINKQPPEGFLEYNPDTYLSEFMVDKNKSVIVLYDVTSPENIKSEGVEYIDLQRDISSKIRECRIHCLKLILPILTILLILLGIIYKSMVKALKITAPSMIAACFSIGLVSLCNQEINMFHVMAIYLIMGFGLDYSVFRASGGKNSSGAIILSCATSVFSFALLALTSFKLISSLGFILAAGLLSSYILSLVLIPSSGLADKTETM